MKIAKPAPPRRERNEAGPNTTTTPLFPDLRTADDAEALIAHLTPPARRAIVAEIVLAARLFDLVQRQQGYPQPAASWRAATRHLRRALVALGAYIAAAPCGTLHDLDRARELLAAELAIITAPRGSAFYGTVKPPAQAPATPAHIVEALTVLRGFMPAGAALEDRDARTVLHAAGVDVYLTI